MGLALIAPALAALLAGLAGIVLQHRLAPKLAAGVLTLAALAIAAATVVALAAVVIAATEALPLRNTWLQWCPVEGPHVQHRVVAVIAFGALVAMVVAGVRRTVVSTSLHGTEAGPLEVVDSDEVWAVAVPGRRRCAGTIVATRGILGALDPAERRALFAHEGAHLRLHHHRYTVAVAAAAAALPLLRPLRAQVRHAVERWADEEAVAVVGDRGVVAAALARAAVAQADHQALLAFGATGVPARVAALLAPPREPSAGTVFAAAALAGVALALAATAMQVHHLVVFALHAC